MLGSMELKGIFLTLSQWNVRSSCDVYATASSADEVSVNVEDTEEVGEVGVRR